MFFIITLCLVSNIKKQKYKIHSSNINGKGAFANKDIKKNEIIDLAVHFNGTKNNQNKFIRTEFGKYINHCDNGNTRVIEVNKYDGLNQTSNLYVQAIKDINQNEEITCNYNNTPFYINNAKQSYKKC